MTEDEKRGKLLAKLRKEKGLTQQDLAELIHYSDKNVSKWERGKSFPTNPNVINKLANIFDISLEEIMYGELKQKENLNEISDNLKKAYLISYNKYIKLIKNGTFIILMITIITMILIYLTYIKNSVKLFVSDIEGNGIDKSKVRILLTSKKNLLALNKLNTKEKQIKNISLFYINNDKEILVFSGTNQMYYIEDKYGYDEYNLETLVKSKSYIKLEYDDSTEEIINLKFLIDYSNDNIFPENARRISKNNETKNNQKNIEEKLLLNGFSREELYLQKKISDNVTCVYNYSSKIISILIYNDTTIENINSSILAKEISYEKISQGNVVESIFLNIDETKNCDEQICLTISDYAMYINYLKNN